MNNHLFICSCCDIEHQLIVQVDEEENELYFNIHLTPLPFFERLWIAIKYIFGKKSKFGEFECLNLSKEDSIKLANLIYEKF